MTSFETQDMLWHSFPSEITFQELKSSSDGIEEKEAKLRLKKFGLNVLRTKSSENILSILLRQLNNSLIYILLASTLLALLLGRTPDAIVVLSVVIINTVIGLIQEYRSGQAIQVLLQMVPQKSTVLRSGIISSISSSEIVPGDVVVLQAGDRIAADLRLFSLKNLMCDESALTGESVPVAKRIDKVEADSTIAERKCMAYSGTLVTSGTGRGVVVATGSHTEFGKISELLSHVISLETPLAHTLKLIARWITIAVVLIGIVLFLVGYLRGYRMLDAGLASIALAVAAIPEGLPATITIATAIGVQRMARRKAIIRHLLAVETLGSTTVICTDKTGTLTQNEMTVQSIWTPYSSFFVTGIGYSPEGQISPHDSSFSLKQNEVELLTAVLLCNDASIELKENRWIPNGDPTELALVVLGRKAGLEEINMRKLWPRLDVIPFDSEKRIMATLHNTPSHKKTIFLKGAPEAVIKMCQGINYSDLHTQIEKMAKQGMRVIAAAKKDLPLDRYSIDEKDIKADFIFLGLLGMIDPPRQEAYTAIRACQEAGITVKMITGDHPLTAGVIGKELGLGSSKAILGAELDLLDAATFKEVVHNHHLFARALPHHKLQIVEALQSNEHVVAMTGDGVNDAPALKRANIGISMGISGTAVAKEAADMILADDNFASIEAAVEEGRRVYDNLIKSITFMFPTNLTQALVIFIAVLFFPIQNAILLLPITPVQILWINLIVAVSLALPIAFEAKEPDTMKRPPRKSKAPLLSQFVLLRTLLVATIMAAGTIGLFFWEYLNELTKGTSEKIAISEAQTMAVTTLIFFQVFYLLNCRSFRFSIFKIGLFSNPYVLLGIGFVIGVQIAFVYLPFMNALFASSPLDLEAWLVSLAMSFIILPIIAFEKWIAKRFLHDEKMHSKTLSH